MSYYNTPVTPRTSRTPRNPNTPNTPRTPTTPTTRSAGNSQSWISTRAASASKLVRMQNFATHIGVFHSPQFPKNVNEYLTHQTEYGLDTALTEKARLENRIVELEAPVKVGKFLNGKKLAQADLTGVLAQKSTWVPGMDVNREGLWPGMEELKYDGELRARAGLTRQLPLPRVNKLGEKQKTLIMMQGGDAKMEIELMKRGVKEIPWQHKALGRVEKMDETDMVRRERIKRNIEREENVGEEGEMRETVPEGGWRFDQDELRGTGAWAELLDEL